MESRVPSNRAITEWEPEKKQEIKATSSSGTVGEPELEVKKCEHIQNAYDINPHKT